MGVCGAGGQELAAKEFGGRGLSYYSPEGWKGIKMGQYANCEMNRYMKRHATNNDKSNIYESNVYE